VVVGLETCSEVVFVCVMKNNDLTGFLKLQLSVWWRQLVNPVTLHPEIRRTQT
jgi:hypothetical protein